jgi:transcriptional regulator with XRE-family HTH domain
MPSILSERIAALRKERGLTQEQLGKLCGVSSQAVGKWEKGGAPDVELLPSSWG